MERTIIREKNPKLVYDNASDDNSSLKELKQISFTLFKEVNFGEAIYLIGNHSKLGSLEIKNAIKMQRDKKHPIWRTEISLEPNDYFYNYFIGGYENINEKSIKPLADFYWPLKKQSFDYLQHESCLDQEKIRTISFNLRYDNRIDVGNLWENRVNLVSEIVFKYLPDFLCTQEGLPNQINDLFENLQVLYEYWGLPRENNGESSGIFYRKDKYVYVDGGHFWLSDTPEKSSKTFGNAFVRICSWIKLKHSHKDFFKNDILVFNTHFDHVSAKSRQLSSLLIIKKIVEINNQNPNSIIILTGDFESDEKEKSIQFILKNDKIKLYSSSQFNSSFTFHEFTGVGSLKKDFIFYNKNLSCYNYKIIDESFNGKYPSDHFPILSDLRVISDIRFDY